MNKAIEDCPDNIFKGNDMAYEWILKEVNRKTTKLTGNYVKHKMTKKIITLVVLLFLSIVCLSQHDSIKSDTIKRNRYIIWLIPSPAANIYGIAFGPIGSESICNMPYTKFSHGINLQIIGYGIFQTFAINQLNYKDLHHDSSDNQIINDSTYKKVVHNGILASLFGTFSDQINGISFSLWMSNGEKINGLSINLLWSRYEQINGTSIALVNHTGISKGLQIGIINKTTKLKGIQIGLWNKNDKRALPIFNMSFNE